MSGKKDISNRPFIVDHVIVRCNACRLERVFDIDPPFTKAEQFITWQKSGVVPPCVCGAPTADMLLHLAELN